MSHHPRALRSTGDFRVVGGRILFARLGPANAQKQHHNSTRRCMVSGKRIACEGEAYESGNPAPASRGYWAFPYPFGESFFYNHVYERHLPKRLLTEVILACSEGDPDLRTSLWQERERCMAEIRKRVRMKLVWHQGPFYAQIRPKGALDPREWWLYDNAREYVEHAQRTFTRFLEHDHFHSSHCVDALQVFVPAGGARASRSCKAGTLSRNVLLPEDDAF